MGFDSTPTFVETLVADGKIDNPMFGIFISPLGQNAVPEGEGEITFGGVDVSRIKGNSLVAQIIASTTTNIMVLRRYNMDPSKPSCGFSLGI